MDKIAEHRINAIADHKIDCPEIGRKQENRNDYYDRRSLHFLERGRGHLFRSLGRAIRAALVRGLQPADSVGQRVAAIS